jgi:GcrA cell cycle regulator
MPDGNWFPFAADFESAPPLVASPWTPERLELLRSLWYEGVTTAAIAKRLNVVTGSTFTKNAVVGKVQRIGLTPRIMKVPSMRRNVFDFAGPACMWPIGHPPNDDFHFCGGSPVAGKPYCEHHMAKAYIRKHPGPEPPTAVQEHHAAL